MESGNDGGHTFQFWFDHLIDNPRTAYTMQSDRKLYEFCALVLLRRELLQEFQAMQGAQGFTSFPEVNGKPSACLWFGSMNGA